MNLYYYRIHHAGRVYTHYEIASSADQIYNDGETVYELTDAEMTDEVMIKCFEQATDYDNDQLTLYLLKRFPTLITEEVFKTLLNNILPQSFDYALDYLSDNTLVPELMVVAARYHDTEAFDSLFKHGHKDNGQALAIVCKDGNRELFDLLLPYSDVENACFVHQGDNKEWLEHEISHKQRLRLLEEVEQGTQKRRSKL